MVLRAGIRVSRCKLGGAFKHGGEQYSISRSGMRALTEVIVLGVRDGKSPDIGLSSLDTFKGAEKRDDSVTALAGLNLVAVRRIGGHEMREYVTTEQSSEHNLDTNPHSGTTGWFSAAMTRKTTSWC